MRYEDTLDVEGSNNARSSPVKIHQMVGKIRINYLLGSVRPSGGYESYMTSHCI